MFVLPWMVLIALSFPGGFRAFYRSSAGTGLIAAVPYGCEFNDTDFELDANIRVVSGKMSAGEARIVLADLDDGDVLFIDECHRLVEGGKRHSEWLLHLLQDGVLMGPLGPEACARVTVIGATTDAGRLPETIIDRFPLRPVLEPYSELEAMRIALHMAAKILLKPLPFPSEADFQRIARAGNHNPRVIQAILGNVRDLVLVDQDSLWDGQDYDLTEALGWLGFSDDGLDRTACRYIQVMLHDFRGQAGARALVDRLQEPGGLGTVERVLLDKGLIAKTRAGRTLTADGIRRAKQLEAA